MPRASGWYTTGSDSEREEAEEPVFAVNLSSKTRPVDSAASVSAGEVSRRGS